MKNEILNQVMKNAFFVKATETIDNRILVKAGEAFDARQIAKFNKIVEKEGGVVRSDKVGGVISRGLFNTVNEAIKVEDKCKKAGLGNLQVMRFRSKGKLYYAVYLFMSRPKLGSYKIPKLT